MQNVDLAHGCSPVLLTVEIVGPEAEGWYCPRIVWTKPDGTKAVRESDCPPYGQRNACYPPPADPASCALDWHIADGRFVVDQNPCDCTVPGFPRLWTLPLCAPESSEDGWKVHVELQAGGKTFAAGDAQFWVK